MWIENVMRGGISVLGLFRTGLGALDESLSVSKPWANILPVHPTPTLG